MDIDIHELIELEIDNINNFIKKWTPFQTIYNGFLIKYVIYNKFLLKIYLIYLHNL